MTDLAFNLIMDCGQAMLANGGEVFRAQDTMEIMARSFGIVDFHVYVLTNGIFASAQNGTVSAVRHVPAVSTNLGHVEAINAISRRVADGELDLNSAQLEFERMKRMPTLSPLYNCAAATMGAGCFAMLFGGGLPEMLVGALGGLLASASSCALSKHHISRIFRDMLSAIACTLTALIAQLVYPALQVNFAIIGALMVLTPGVALTMGVRDILNGDYLSGSIRLLDALLIAGSIAGGVVLGWIMARGFGGGVMPVWTHYFAHFVVAVIATISFGITFQMPRRHYLACGLTGAVGWMVYIFGVELFALSPAIATLVATLPLTGCARFFAIRHKAPVTYFSAAGHLSLVPGAGIYLHGLLLFCRASRSFSPAKAARPSRSRWPWRWALRWCAVCRCRAGMRESANRRGGFHIRPRALLIAAHSHGRI